MSKSTRQKIKTVKKIYVDYAASVLPNPSSIHGDGVAMKTKLQNSRIMVASILSSRPTEIIFTSGGTESNNLAIQGVVLAFKEKYIPHIITTNIEHPSVLLTYKMLEKRKLAQVSIVPVELNGIINPQKIIKEIRKNTVLVSVMYANNEIGTIQPIKEIAKGIRYYRKTTSSSFPIFHTDAIQAANYLDINVERLGVDLLSLSGTKIYDAGRVGVLFKRKPVLLEPMFSGGDQEFGLRPGTENLLEIIKFSNALCSAQKIKEKETKRLIYLRDYFIKKLLKIKNIKINGDLKNRLPNNINIIIPKIPSDLLVLELSAKGVMVSAKSACKSGDGKASHVIKAINPDAEDTDGSLRFSLGKTTTKKDVDYIIKVLIKILKKLKKWYN